MPYPYIKSALVISLKTDTKNSWLPWVKSARSQYVLGLNPKPQTLSPGWIHPQRLWKRLHPIQIQSKTQIVIHVTMLNSSIAALEENNYPGSYIHWISINTSKCFINGQTEVGCIFLTHVLSAPDTASRSIIRWSGLTYNCGSWLIIKRLSICNPFCFL